MLAGTGVHVVGKSASEEKREDARRAIEESHSRRDLRPFHLRRLSTCGIVQRKLRSKKTSKCEFGRTS